MGWYQRRVHGAIKVIATHIIINQKLKIMNTRDKGLGIAALIGLGVSALAVLGYKKLPKDKKDKIKSTLNDAGTKIKDTAGDVSDTVTDTFDNHEQNIKKLVKITSNSLIRP